MFFPKKRHFMFCIAALMMLILLAACGGEEASNQDTGNENSNDNANSPNSYKVAAVLPLTGGESELGKDMVTAMQMGINSINEEGGINGVPLELVVEDSAADPNRSITAYRKVVDVDNAPIVVSAWSSVINAMAPLAEQDKTLLLSVGAGSPNIKDLGDYTRTTSVLADTNMEGLARYSYEHLGARKVAILYINNDTGKYPSEAYRDAFTELGGEVTAFESHAPGATDFSAQLSKIKASNPDVLHVQSLIEETPFIIRQARDMGIDATFSTYSGVFGESLIENGGEAAEGMLGTSYLPDAEYSEEVVRYIERWEEEEGRLPQSTALTALYADSVYIVKDIIEKIVADGKEVNGESALAALEEIREFNLPISGTTIFNEDRTVMSSTVINEISNGEIKTIEIVEPEN